MEVKKNMDEEKIGVRVLKTIRKCGGSASITISPIELSVLGAEVGDIVEVVITVSKKVNL